MKLKNMVLIVAVLGVVGCSQYKGTGFVVPEDYKLAEKLCADNSGLLDVTANGNIRESRSSVAYGPLTIRCNSGRTFVVAKWKD